MIEKIIPDSVQRVAAATSLKPVYFNGFWHVSDDNPAKPIAVFDGWQWKYNLPYDQGSIKMSEETIIVLLNN